MSKHIVCFGGGSGLPEVVLEPLKNEKDIFITSITSMVDNGGSTGALRKEFNVLPPGDIRRHILALSEAEEWKKKLWKFRFANDVVFEDGHKGHNFANVFIAALEHFYGIEKALEIVHEFMKVRGRCLPATIEKVQLFAELENGQIIEGEDEIDVPMHHDGNLKIRRIWIEPKARAYDKAVEAVKSASAIIIGPGDLYSSILPCFLPEGMKEAISSSKAIKIFVAPAMTKFGETNDFYLEDFVEEVERYIGCRLDYIVYNTKIPSDESILAFKRKNPHLLNIVRPRGELDDRFVGRDLLISESEIVYSPEKVKEVLLNILSCAES